MPTITDITIRGRLKGRAFHDQLGGVDAYAGPNGSGKTTRLLALLGAIHGLAQTTTDRTRPYLGEVEPGTEAEVITTDGSWRRDLGIQNPTARAHKDATADAHRIVGAPIVSWDLSDWSAGTDGDRRKLLDRIARAGGAVEAWTYSDAQNRVRERMQEMDGGDDLVDDLVQARPRAGDAALWLQVAEEWANDAAKAARKAARGAEAVLRAATEERKAQPEQDPADDLASARQRLAGLKAASTEGQRHHERLEQARVRLADIQKQGADLRAQADPEEPSYDDGRRAEAAVAEARAEADKPVPPIPDAEPVDPALVEAVSVAEAAWDAADDAFERARLAHREADNDLRVAEAAHRAYEAAQKATAGLRAQASMPCQHCGGLDPLGVLEGVEQAEAPPDMEGARAAETAAAEAVRDTQADRNTAARALQAARDALARAEGAARGQVADAERRVASIKATRQDAINRAEQQLAQVRREHAQAMQWHERAIKTRAANLARMRDDWKTAKARLDSLEAAQIEGADPAAVEQAQQEVERLQALADVWRDYERAEERVRRAAVGVTAAETHRKATEALVEAVRAVRLEQAAACYGPVEDAARALLADAWEGSPQPYLAGPGDYGAVVKGQRVRYEALSESERRITAAALVYALAVVARQPCRLVLIDGLEVVQSDHRGPLLAALARARDAGMVDNVIVTCAVSEEPDQAERELADLALPGVTIHRLGGEDEPADIQPAPITTPTVEDDSNACPF